MTEEFLHHVWNYALFNSNNLQTTSGENIEIISPGTPNKESGPDFFNGKIKLDSITWAGQIEIHVRSSEWNKHGHQHDPAYHNTILHVVYEDDQPVKNQDSIPIPTLELKGRISKSLLDQYQSFIHSGNKLVCQGFTANLDEFKTKQWLDRLLVERLEQKTQLFSDILHQQKGNWAQTFFIALAKNLGFKTNALPMQLLAQSIDFTILVKNASRIHVLEAILFGVAGLLPEEDSDSYVVDLKREFAHQQVKYGFEPLNPGIWKFGRVRPSNFPTLRISQLAHLIHNFGNLFDVLVRDFALPFDKKMLNVNASSYWNTHFSFSKPVKSADRKLGISSIHNILINTVAPVLFFYGQRQQSFHYQDLAFRILEELPAEKNSILALWERNNILASNAYESQSIIQLTNQYCNRKKCVNCGIGIQILK
jgi:hypothetical protein